MKPEIAIACRFQLLLNRHSSVMDMDAQMPRARDCMDAGGMSPWMGEVDRAGSWRSRATPGAVAEDAAEKLLLRLSTKGRLRAPHFRHPWRSRERLCIGGQ